MGAGVEGEEAAVDQFKGVSKTHTDEKASNDCSPATVPRKLRSAMNKRGRESVSPPLPEVKKQNASKGSRIITMAHINGIKKSKHILKHVNGVVKSTTRKSSSATVTKTEEEVAEALYVLSRLSPARSVGRKTDSAIAEAKDSTLPEDKASTAPANFPTEASSKKLPENAIAVKTDVSRKCVEVHTSVATDAIPLMEKLDPKSEAGIDVKNHSEFNKQASGPPLTDVQNNVILPCGQPNSQNRLAQPFTLNLLPPYEAEKGPLQIRPTFVFLKSLCLRRKSSLTEVLCLEVQYFRFLLSIVFFSLRPSANKDEASQDTTVHGSKSILHLDLSKPPSTQDAAWKDAAEKGNVAASACKDPSQGKKSLKRCATHVHLSHFIHETKSVGKVPQLAAQYNQPSEVNGGVAKAACDSSKYKEYRSCSLTTSSFERNPQVPCLQLLPEKKLVSDQSFSRKSQSIDFLSLSPGGGGDRANLEKPNKGVEPSLPVNSSSYIQSVQHQFVSPFSIQAARLPNSFADQQSVETATAQQVLLPQYLANPSLNPHYAGAAMSTTTSPAGKHQQQLWAPDVMQYYQSTQFPKLQNGWKDGVTLHPCSQSSYLPTHLTMAYAHSSQLFPVSSSGNKRPPQKH